ncbi:MULTISPECIES: NUDIX domain-containing protein [Providencia]|uniref:NUDIX domain-containing protein n=1 Tax=Providencia TaxID=586 RepID=UPI0014096631
MIEKYIPHSVISKLKNYDRVVVGGLIKAGHDSKILFLKRSEGEFMPNVWEIPSGGMEYDEDMQTALSREIAEETGMIVIEISGFVGAVEYQAIGQSCIQLNFNVLCSGHICLSSEHSDFAWSTIESFKGNLDGFMLRTFGLQ